MSNKPAFVVLQVLIATGVSVILSCCGQRGPLKLPEATPQETAKPQASETTPEPSDTETPSSHQQE